MKKKIFSILLTAAMIFSILPMSYAGASSDLVLLEQDFAGLTELPEGWTALGELDVNYSFSTDSISTTQGAKNAYAKVYKNDAYNSNGEEYKVSFGVSHYGGAKSYVHIGTDSTSNAVLEKAAPVGYSILFTTTDYKKAVIKLYKDGVEIGTLSDKGANYAHSSLRNFELSVSDDKVVLSGANSVLEVEDSEPIYSGYIGFALKNNNASNSKTKLSKLNITKTLKYTGSNLSDSHGVSDSIELNFNCSLDDTSVTKDNVYITDSNGVRIPVEDFDVACDDNKVIIEFNSELGYSTDYNVIIKTTLYADGTTIGLASEQRISFKTQEPPFYVEVVGNSITVPQDVEADIEIELSHTLDSSCVTKSTVYITDDTDVKIDEALYNVEYKDGKIVISFNKMLEYTTVYKVVLEKALYAEGTKIGMADKAVIEFTTVDPPFYINNTVEGNNLKITVGNTMYESMDFKIFARVKNTDGDVIGSYSFDVSMPEKGSKAEYTKEVTENLTDAQIEIFTVSTTNVPIWNSFAVLDSEKSAAADIYENKLTEKGKNQVEDNLKDLVFEDVDTLYKAFAKAVVAASVNGWYESGFEHINNVLNTNGEFAELDMEEYSKAVGTAAMDEYIYNSDVKNIDDLQTAINKALIETDRAYYSHTVTSNDVIDSDWEFYINGKNDVSRVTDNGFTATKEINNAQMFSKFNVEGDFEFYGDFTRPYNSLVFYFDYADASNHCSVEFKYSSESSQFTKVVRVVDGTSYTCYTDNSDGGFEGKKIVVEEDGRVSIFSGSEALATVDLTAFGGKLKGGKIGFGLKNTPGSVKSVNLLRYLRAETEIETERVEIDTQNVGVKFNYFINPATAIKENVSLYENGKQIYDYEIEAKEDFSGFDVIMLKPLSYKSKYDIVISPAIKVNYGKSYLLNAQTLTFYTVNPEFNVTSFTGICGDKPVFENDMTTINEVYTSYIKSFADKDAEIRLDFENSGDEMASVTAVIELADENGEVLYNSGCIPVEVARHNNVYIKVDVHIPADVSENAKFSYYVFDTEEGLHTVYPYKENISSGTGESPNVSKKGNDVIVWGSTVGNNAGKNINLLVKGDTNGEVIKTASTVTDDNGEYKFTFTINQSLLSEFGYVTVNVSGEEFEKAVSQKLYIADDTDRNDAVKDINKRTDTKEALEEYKNVLDISSANSYGLKLYENLTEAELVQLVALVDADKPYDETDSGEIFLKKILEKIVLVHYNNGNTDMLYSADGKMLTDDIIDFSKLPEVGNTYSIYVNNLTENGRKAVRNGILKKNCTTVSDLCKVYAQNVVTYGVNNWYMNGVGHIYNLLTQNARITGLDTTKYVKSINRTQFEQGLLNNPVSDFEELQTRINAIQNVPGTGGGGSGSGSGGGTGGGGGGGYGSPDSTVSGSYGTSQSSIGTGTAKRFKDLSGFDWAQTAVEYLAEYNITTGYGDETFRPANAIVREEFITLVAKAFSLTTGPEEPVSFNDVDSNAWYAEYIKAAQSNKIIEGYDGMFGVGTLLTRQDAVVILTRVLETKGYELIANSALISGYSDVTEISDYAADAFCKLVSAGIINGVGNNSLAPKANCTRAEMAVMLYNVLMRYNKE